MATSLCSLLLPCGRWADGASADAEAERTVAFLLRTLSSESVSSLSRVVPSCREIERLLSGCAPLAPDTPTLLVLCTGRTVEREEFHEEFLFVQKLILVPVPYQHTYVVPRERASKRSKRVYTK
jgi:hypothetical protein